MQILIVQEHDFREKYRLLALFLALPFSSDIQHGNGSQLSKPAGTSTCGNGNKGIITTAAGYCIELVLPSLEALLELSYYICITFCFCSVFINSHTSILFNISVIRLLSIRLQNQIHTWYGKATVLLTGCTEYNIADNVKSNIQALRLIIPDISHFKTACQHTLHIEQTAVHGISSGRHVMDINIAVTACLNLFCSHKKFLIQFFVQLIKNQTSLGRYQC